MKTKKCLELNEAFFRLKRSLYFHKGERKFDDIKEWKLAERFRDGMWPTLFCEGWEVAETFVGGMVSCRHAFNEYVWTRAQVQA